VHSILCDLHFNIPTYPYNKNKAVGLRHFILRHEIDETKEYPKRGSRIEAVGYSTSIEKQDAPAYPILRQYSLRSIAKKYKVLLGQGSFTGKYLKRAQSSVSKKLFSLPPICHETSRRCPTIALLAAKKPHWVGFRIDNLGDSLKSLRVN
jgi:hypothetical protein